VLHVSCFLHRFALLVIGLVSCVYFFASWTISSPAYSRPGAAHAGYDVTVWVPNERPDGKETATDRLPSVLHAAGEGRPHTGHSLGYGRHPGQSLYDLCLIDTLSHQMCYQSPRFTQYCDTTLWRHLRQLSHPSNTAIVCYWYNNNNIMYY